MRGLDTLIPMKGVGYPESYPCGDVGTAEINGGVRHVFLDFTYIKNMSDNIEKIFETTPKK